MAGALILDAGHLHPISIAATGALLYNMFIAFVFCHWAWFKIATTAPASIAALSTMMIPVVGVVSGMLVLGEQPHWQEYAALLLVTLSLATVLIFPGNRAHNSAPSAGPGESGHSA
jgi:drug/metabolite transporter (DMT)-like permease